MKKNRSRKNPSLNLRYVANLIIFGNIIFLLVAIIFYRGHFNFWLDPFSNLGDAVDNPVSARVFTLGMVYDALIFFILSRYYFKLPVSRFHKFNATICALGGGGFLIGGFAPDDTMHNFHVAGMALAVAALWLWLNSLVFEKKCSLSLKKYCFLELLLQGPILIYAGAYFAAIDPASYAFQKITLFALGLVLYSATGPTLDIPLSENSVSR